MYQKLEEYLFQFGLSAEYTEYVIQGKLIILSLMVSWLAYWIAKGPIISMIERFTKFTEKNKWDDILFEKRVFHRIAQLVPFLVLYQLMPLVLKEPASLKLVMSLITILLLFNGLLVLDALLNAFVALYSNLALAEDISITPFVQVIKLVLFFIFVILVASIVLQKTPLYLLSGLGALTAILMLVFKDIIMGLVAGVQLIANKMVAPKDWIEMSRYGADGDVLEITLTTVKVKNFDNTITTIPTYALITESFKNWRNMPRSGGRRIKRSVLIDQNSIQFCTEEMFDRFYKIQLISEQLKARHQEIMGYNQEREVDDQILVNGRRITNIGVFRSYVEEYLRNHPKIHQDMTFMIRQLPPSENGLPIEIYVFCKNTNWVAYEGIQADIFDHILAIIPHFDLKVFQIPSGADFQNLRT